LVREEKNESIFKKMRGKSVRKAATRFRESVGKQGNLG